MEKNRQLKEIKSGLEVKVTIYDKENFFLKILKDFDLTKILIVSKIELSDKFNTDFDFLPENKNLGIKIEKFNGSKCPRCWQMFLPEN